MAAKAISGVIPPLLVLRERAGVRVLLLNGDRRALTLTLSRSTGRGERGAIGGIEKRIDIVKKAL
jgi:hypothetical protein